MSKAYIIGGGPSLRGVDLSLLKSQTTIGVNKSIFSLTNPSYFITVDYTVIRKLGIERLRALTCPRFFVVNFSVPSLQVKNGGIVDTKWNLVYQDIYDCFDTIILSRQPDGVGTTLRDFRSGNNSGYCGMQLAIALGYTEIYLLGIDLTTTSGVTHYHGGYNEVPTGFTKKLPGYYQTFVQGLKEIRTKLPHVSVYSCSPISLLNADIPYISLGESLTR